MTFSQTPAVPPTMSYCSFHLSLLANPIAIYTTPKPAKPINPGLIAAVNIIPIGRKLIPIIKNAQSYSRRRDSMQMWGYPLLSGIDRRG